MELGRNRAAGDVAGRVESIDPGKIYTTTDMAERYAVSIETVRKWRATGAGPRAIKAGKHVRYRGADVLAWEEANADPESVAS